MTAKGLGGGVWASGGERFNGPNAATEFAVYS